MPPRMEDVSCFVPHFSSWLFGVLENLPLGLQTKDLRVDCLVLWFFVSLTSTFVVVVVVTIQY